MKQIDYNLLSPVYSPEQVESVRNIIDGVVSPEIYQSVQNLLRQCYNTPRQYDLQMCAIDEILGNYGTEALTGNWQNGYWCDIVAVYSNNGDSYAPTLVYHRDHGFMVCGWADIIELFPDDFQEVD